MLAMVLCSGLPAMIFLQLELLTIKDGGTALTVPPCCRYRRRNSSKKSTAALIAAIASFVLPRSFRGIW